MKVALVCVCIAVVACVRGEAPESSSGPYPPAQWRPSGRAFFLPARQQVSTVYGPPPAEYGPPPAPSSTTEAASAETTTTTKPSDKPQEDAAPPKADSERLVDAGVYYVLLPDGKLQMVRYSTGPLRSEKQQTAEEAEASSNFDSEKIKFQQQKQEQLSQVQAHHAQFEQFKLPSQKPSNFNQQTQFNLQPSSINQQQTQVNFQKAQLNQLPVVLEPTPFQYVEIQKPQNAAEQKSLDSTQQQPLKSSQFNQLPQEPAQFHYVEVQRSREIEVPQPAPEQPSAFVANLQYRDVEPISAPVYAFNPTPLVRILK